MGRTLARAVAENWWAGIEAAEAEVALVSNGDALNVIPLLSCFVIPRAPGAESTSDMSALVNGSAIKWLKYAWGEVDRIHPIAREVYTQKFEPSRAVSPRTKARYSTSDNALSSCFLLRSRQRL
jgi:hypothetical protein